MSAFLRPSATILCTCLLAFTTGAQEKQAIQTTVKRLESKLDEIEGYLQNLESRAAPKADPELAKVQEETATRARALQEQVATLEAALATERERVARSSERTGELEQALTAARASLAEAKQRTEELQLQVTAAQEANAQLAERERALTMAARTTESDAAARMARLESELQAVSAREAKAIEAAGELKAQNANLAMQARELEERLARTSKQAESKATDLVAAHAQVEQLQARQRELVAKFGALEQLAESERAMRSRLEDIATREARANDHIARLEQENRELAEVITGLRNEHAHLASEYEPTPAASGSAQGEVESTDQESEGEFHVHNQSGTVIVQLGSGTINIHGPGHDVHSPPARRSPGKTNREAGSDESPTPLVLPPAEQASERREPMPEPKIN